MSRLVHWLPLSLAFNCVPRSAGSEFETTWQTQVEQRTRLPENSAKRVHYGNDGGSIFICLFDYAFMVEGSVADICKSNLRLKRENKCSLQDIFPFSLFFSGVLFCKKLEKKWLTSGSRFQSSPGTASIVDCGVLCIPGFCWQITQPHSVRTVESIFRHSQMVLAGVCKNHPSWGWCDSSTGKDACCQPDGPSPAPRTQVVEREINSHRLSDLSMYTLSIAHKPHTHTGPHTRE